MGEQIIKESVNETKCFYGDIMCNARCKYYKTCIRSVYKTIQGEVMQVTDLFKMSLSQEILRGYCGKCGREVTYPEKECIYCHSKLEWGDTSNFKIIHT